jgi:hypothetical protein
MFNTNATNSQASAILPQYSTMSYSELKGLLDKKLKIKTGLDEKIAQRDNVRKLSTFSNIFPKIFQRFTNIELVLKRSKMLGQKIQAIRAEMRSKVLCGEVSMFTR